MILVTVGTHPQPMRRLGPGLERIARDMPELGPFHAQLGPTPAPRGWDAHGLLATRELARLVASSDIVVTHGGPASIAQARAAGHIPIVVPRSHAAGEHVDDHQVSYSRRLAAAGEILLVEDAALLPDIVRAHATLAARLPAATSHDPSSAVRKFGAVAERVLSRIA